MFLDRSHRPWVASCALVASGAAALYFSTAAKPLHPVSGGSTSGLTFGMAGTACMFFAAALTLRKQLKAWRLGKTSRWLAGHIWLGVLALPLICFHAGFRFGGPLTTGAMLLLLASWLSGVLGLVLQQVVPRLMTEQVPRETIYEQIDHVLELLRAEARALVEAVAGPIDAPTAPAAATAALPTTPTVGSPKPAPAKAPRPGSEPLKAFYVEQVAPFLAPSRPPRSFFAQSSTAVVQRAHVKRLIPAELHETVDDLFDVCDERRQIEKQRRLHLWLHGWLFVHVPLSWALLAATAFHAVRALRF